MPGSTCSGKGKAVFQVIAVVMLTVFLSVSAHALNPAGSGQIVKDVPGTGSLSDSTKILQFKSGKHITAFQPGKIYIASFDHALSMEFVGGRRVDPKALSSSPDRGGKGPALLGRVEYRDQWEGITVRYDAVEGGIAESTYIVEPGADVKAIRLRYNVPVEAGPDGSLKFRLSSKRGAITETAPVAWQEIGGKKVPVKVAFKVTDGLVGFQVASYDTRHTLIIDPTYQWHTFYGQTQGDEGTALALDGDGNVYVAGFSYNSVSGGTWNGPAGQAPIHAHSGGPDIMVMKLNSSGEYQWHTFYGDPDRQWAKGIAVDGSGNVYVTGFTDGAQWLGDGGASPIRMGQSDGGHIVVLKLSTNGAYQWHTFYGYWVDEGYAIAVDGNGVYVTGQSAGSSGQGWVDMPAALHAHSGDGYDIVVLKLSLNGAYQWHTFYGSAGDVGADEGRAIALDGSGNVYVTGKSQFTWQGAGAVNPLHDHSFSGTNGKPDIFVLKLNSSGGYLWHTFYGATYANPYWATGEVGNGIAVDESGNVYVAGTSAANWGTPVHPYTKGLDITVLKLNSNGVYQWHTFYGSDGNNYGHAIAVKDDEVFVAGDGWGTWLGDGGKPPVHPFTLGCGLTILKLNMNGAYKWHTFYDYSANITSGVGHGVGVDGDGSIYVSSSSTASWLGDGSTAAKHAYTGANDITVVKLDPVSTLTVQKSGTGFGTVTGTSVINCGATCAASFADGTVIVLTAAADGGSNFIGWSGGGCTGTGTCTVTLNGAAVVTATFNVIDNPCTYTIKPAYKLFTANGGSTNVIVKATGAATCDKPILTPSAPWLTAAFTAADWKRNQGTVKITALKSATSKPEPATVAIADQTFNAEQKPVLCNITKLLPPSATTLAEGGSSFFDITLSAGDCEWTTLSDKTWITPDASGSGSARVNYTVDLNDSGLRRTGKITVTLTANGKKRPHTAIQLK